MLGREVTILLVDDDKVDRMAIRRSFRQLNISNPVVEVQNGIEALEYLRGPNGFPKSRAPFLILLDLNMPRMGGIEFLEQIRGDPSLHRSVVFVMSTSGAKEDVARAYDKNIAGYLMKHSDGISFTEMVTMLRSYCTTVSFPE